MKKPLLIAAGIVIALAGFAFFGLHVWNERDALLSVWSRGESVGAAFTASALLFASIYVVTAKASTWILRDLGAPTATRPLIAILCVSQLARYVPGNVGQHLARGSMLAAQGIPTAAIVLSLTLETLLAVAAAGLLAVLALGIGFDASTHLGPWAVVMALVASLGIVALLAIGPRILPRRFRDHAWVLSLHRVSWRTRMACLACYAANYVNVGAGLALLAYSLDAPGSPLLYVAAFAVAWIVGFLAPGLPAGLGAREGVLVALLAPTTGAATAVVIATAHRLSTTLGDALAACAGAMLLRYRSRRGLPGNPP